MYTIIVYSLVLGLPTLGFDISQIMKISTCTENIGQSDFSFTLHESTGQSISSIGRVPIEILPGKRHIT